MFEYIATVYIINPYILPLWIYVECIPLKKKTKITLKFFFANFWKNVGFTEFRNYLAILFKK